MMVGNATSGARWVAATCLLLGVSSVAFAVQARPQHYSFALDGAVREVKSICAGATCSSFVLLVPPPASLGSGGGEPGARVVDPTLELWQLQFPSSSSASAASVEPNMRRLGFDIPNDAGRLALCGRQSGPTGAGERSPFLVMFQAQGSVFFVDPDADDAPRNSGTRVGSDKWSAPARPWTLDCSELLLVGPGEARLVRLAGRGTRRSVLSSTVFPITLSIRRNGSGLTLESPEVRRIDQGESSLIVVGPKVYDSLRIETLVFPPTDSAVEWLEQLGSSPSATDRRGKADGPVGGEAVGGGAGSVGASRMWSRLPGAERVLSSRYLVVEGVLVLVVVTKEADKMGLLERKKLRLFRLAADRTRLGNLPFFEALSASRLWQRLDVKFMDVSGDGIEDLVLLQPEGLSGEPTVADVFIASAPLQFAKKKVRTVLKTGLVWWSLDNDWDGDGLVDVVVLDEGTLQFHSGLRADVPAGRRRKKGKGFWSSEPSYTFHLEGLGANSRGGKTDGNTYGKTDGEARGKQDPEGQDEEDDAEEEVDVFPSSLRKVWVDDGVLVIPTGRNFQQVVLTDEGEMITVSGPEVPAANASGKKRRVKSMIHVVRVATPAVDHDPKN